MTLCQPTAFRADFFEPLRKGFLHLYQPGHLYRQTGVVLGGLIAEEKIVYSLFDDRARVGKMSRIYETVDHLPQRYGKYAVHHSSSLPTKLQSQHEGEKGDTPERKADLFKEENKRQRLAFPMLHIKV